jgi:hypothetical protein
VWIFTHWFYFSFCIPGTNIMDRDWIKHRFSSQQEGVEGGGVCHVGRNARNRLRFCLLFAWWLPSGRIALLSGLLRARK